MGFNKSFTMELMFLMAIVCNFASAVEGDLTSSRYRNGGRKRQPIASPVCNRIFQGSVGNVYPLTILKSANHKVTGTNCLLNITAGGGKLGDIIQITVFNLNIGRHSVDGCPQGMLQIWEPELQSTPSGGWCGGTISEYNPMEYYSTTSVVSISVTTNYSSSDEDQQLVYLHYRLIDKDSIDYSRHLNDDVENPNCHAKTKNDLEAIAGCEGRPAKREVFIGERVPNTVCDRVFYNCRKRNCVLLSPNWPGSPPRNLTCRYFISSSHTLTSSGVAEASRNVIQLGPSKSFRLKHPGRIRLDWNGNYFKSWNECNKSANIDWLEIREGIAENSPVLFLTCESNYFEELSSKANTLVLTYKAIQYDNPVPTRLYLHGFRIPVTIRESQFLSLAPQIESERNYMTLRVKSSPVLKSGTLQNPDFNNRKLSEVSFTFQGLSDERVLLYFSRYILPFKWEHSSQDEGSTLSVLQILDGLTGEAPLIAEFKNEAYPPLCEYISYEWLTTTLNASLKWNEMGEKRQGETIKQNDHKKEETPELKAPAGRYKRRGKNQVPAESGLSRRPCRFPETFLSSGSGIIVRFLSGKGFPLNNLLYTMHYQFISHDLDGTLSDEAGLKSTIFSTLDPRREVIFVNRSTGISPPVNSYFRQATKIGGFEACDRTLPSRGFGTFGSPKATLFYGQGGMKELVCYYRFRIAAGKSLTLTSDNFVSRFGKCQNWLDISGRWICHFNGKSVSTLYIYEVFGDSCAIRRHCICSNAASLIFRSISDTVVIRYEIIDMDWTDGPNDFSFQMSYDFTSNDSNSDNGVTTLITNSGIANIRNCHGRISSPYCSRNKLWSAFLTHPFYIRIQGRELSEENRSCPNEDRISIFSTEGLDQVICPSKEENETVEIFSDHFPRKRDSNIIFIETRGTTSEIELIKIHRMTNDQLRKPELSFYSVANRQAIENDSSVPCANYCPEFNGCIDSQLWCDGKVHCPYSFNDERNCTQKEIRTLLSDLGNLIGYVSTGIGILFSCLLLTCAIYHIRKCNSYRADAQKPGNPRPFVENYI